VLKVTVRLPGGELLNVWNTHLQDGASPQLRRSQIEELIAHVRAAEDGQIADIVGGDFNCTPDSPLFQELAESLGPTVQQLSGKAPYVTWDGLSAKPGRGKTLDHIFIYERAAFQTVTASTHAVFTASNPQRRLSDHLAIEAAVTLTPAASLAGAAVPRLARAQTSGGLPQRAVYAGAK
jgi:endonuclease/exonuclease/phosphatase family metal-dependent hydrolase